MKRITPTRAALLRRLFIAQDSETYDSAPWHRYTEQIDQWLLRTLNNKERDCLTLACHKATPREIAALTLGFCKLPPIDWTAVEKIRATADAQIKANDKRAHDYVTKHFEGLSRETLLAYCCWNDRNGEYNFEPDDYTAEDLRAIIRVWIAEEKE